MTSEAIAEAQQRLEVGSYVELFAIDLTPLGGTVQYWTPTRPNPGENIKWRGQIYTPIEIQTEGFDRSAKGTLPTPKLTVSNADNIIGVLLSTYDDLLGITITRRQTLYEFLDDQPEADPDAEWPCDIFRVERKASRNKYQVTLELSAAIDQEGVMLPRRVALRDFCPLRYRTWNGSGFDYTDAKCPYTGTAYYDEQGLPVAASNDACGKRVSDCKLRFGANAELPYGGFPGMARMRIR